MQATPAMPASHSAEKRVDGDVTADLRHDGDVHVAGSAGAVAITGTAIRIDGNAAGARVTAQTTLRVAGSVSGGGRCMADRTIDCSDAADATLLAGGDLRVADGLRNARVCSGGSVAVGGAIRGGKVAANAGIRCDTAGSDTGEPTVLAAGVDLYFQAVVARRRPDIERDRALADRTRSQVKPLTEKMKSLSAQQRESVTVTLYEADQLDHAVETAMNELRTMYQQSRRQESARIDVAGVLHKGVTVRLGGTTVVIPGKLEGPLRLTAAETDGSPAACVTYTQTGETLTLPATSVDDPHAAIDAFLSK